MRRYIDRRRSTTNDAVCDWSLASDDIPPLAAHLITARFGYTHHGIFVGDGKVVHYAGLSRSWQSRPVEEITLAEFACGRAVRVRPCPNPQFDAREVAARARSRLGENRYRVFSNNCEHFCEWCLRGRSRSRQIDRLRPLPRRAMTQLSGRLARVWSDLRDALGSNPQAWAG